MPTSEASAGTDDSAPGTRPVKRASWASFARFVTVGGATTALTAGLFLALDEGLPIVAANLLSMVVGTIAANELHARWTFRSPKRGLRMHTEAGFTTLITYTLSSGSLYALERLEPEASSLVKIGVQIGATAVAGIVRYVVLLVWVFAVHRRHPDAGEVHLARPSAAGATRFDPISSARSGSGPASS